MLLNKPKLIQFDSIFYKIEDMTEILVSLVCTADIFNDGEIQNANFDQLKNAKVQNQIYYDIKFFFSEQEREITGEIYFTPSELFKNYFSNERMKEYFVTSMYMFLKQHFSNDLQFIIRSSQLKSGMEDYIMDAWNLKEEDNINDIEEEKLLLGDLLNDNALFNKISEINEDFFYLPIHQKIYKEIANLINQGLIADPVALKHKFDQDEAFKNYNGGMYLFKLAKASFKKNLKG